MESKHRLDYRAFQSRCVRFGSQVALTALAAALIALPASGDGVLIGDRVLVDTDRGTAFVMSADGGLDAIDLGLGQLQWRTESAAKPLLLDGDRLLAQDEPGPTGALRVVTLDAGSSSVLGRAEVDLPDGVRGDIDDRPFTSFRTRATRQGDSAMIWWSKSSTTAVSPVAPGPNEGIAPGGGTAALAELPAKKGFERLEGVAQMDWSSGQTKALAIEAVKASAPGAAALSELTGADRLERAGRQFLSVDGHHVLISARVPATRSVWGQYRWTVVDRASGADLGTVTHHAAVAPFLVFDGRLVYVSEPRMMRQGDDFVREPLQLRAVELASGVEVWNHKVRNTDFAGPFAP